MHKPTPRFGHEPIPMRRVDNDDAIERAGDFCWERDEAGAVTHIWLAHPSPVAGGMGHVEIRIGARPGPNVKGRHWGWDGNADVPTLTPSIHTHGHWHGWVRAGKLVEA